MALCAQPFSWLYPGNSKLSTVEGRDSTPKEVESDLPLWVGEVDCLLPEAAAAANEPAACRPCFRLPTQRGLPQLACRRRLRSSRLSPQRRRLNDVARHPRGLDRPGGAEAGEARAEFFDQGPINSWVFLTGGENVGSLERLYAVFRLSPFGSPAIRAVKKARKHYHFDWTLAAGPAARFENLVACHLLKWVHHQQDTQGRDLELRYFRDTDGREVDFVVTEGRRPLWLVECKRADARVDKALRYLHTRFPECEAWQISAAGNKDFQSPEGIRVCPALGFLASLV